MATPAEIITNVLDILERPDLNSLAISRFPKALRSAHAVDTFRRDLVSESLLLADYSVVDGAVGIAIPARFRKMYRAWSSNASGEVDRQFFDLGNNLEKRTYFGFQIQQTYSIFGQVINFAGISTDATHLRLDYLRFPTWEYVDGAWTTDSWIAVEAPELIEAYLQFELAKLTEDDAQKQSAMNAVSMARSHIISTYVEEII